MSQAEELLNTLAEVAPSHTHAVTDTDTYFIIDPNTRQIENTNRNKTVIMQYDHNSERFTFQLPRYIDGHDMLQCNSVIVNFDNIEAETDNTYSDICDMSAIKIDPAHNDRVITSWLITRNATQLAGALNFSIEFKCTDSEGNIVYEWGTDTYDRIEVKPRSKNDAGAIVEHEDILEQWRVKIFGAGDSVMANIAAAGEAQVEAVKTESATQQEAVELKGSDTLASIPEDYTSTNNMAEDAVRSKSDAIVCEDAGRIIDLNNSSDDYIRGLKMYGKTTQKTTTGAQLFNAKNCEGTGSNDSINISDDEYTITAVGGIGAKYCFSKFPLDANKCIGKTLIMSVDSFTGGANCSIVLFCFIGGVNKQSYSLKPGNASITCPIADNVEEVKVHIYTNDSGTELTSNGTATVKGLVVSYEDCSWEPYTGGIPSPNPAYPQEIESVENPEINVCSRNLLIEPAIGIVSVIDGITCEYEGNGIYHFYGTREHTISTPSYLISESGIPVDLDAPYTISTKLIEGVVPDNFHPFVGLKSDTVNHQNWIEAGVKPTTEVGTVVTKTMKPKTALPDATKIDRFWIFLNTYNNENYTADFRIQVWLEKSNTSTEYTPYSRQLLNISRTIPGVPVPSGGNYTDENGKQWVCDEVDLERGVYIQRIKEFVLSDLNPDTWYTWGVNHSTEGITGFYHYYTDPVVSDYVVSNIGLYGAATWGGLKTGVGASWKSKYLTVSVNNDMLDDVTTDVSATESLKTMLANTNAKMLVIIEPTERPLTVDEIEAFKLIRTNCPNTTILNDAGAWMSVKYNADTKTYVENPKTLKLVDSSTGLVYELKIVNGNLTVVQV